MTECARSGCGKPAAKYPVLSFAAEKMPMGPRAEFLVPLGVCEEHAAEAAAEDFMSDDGWAQICQGFARLNRARPGRGTLDLARFESIS